MLNENFESSNSRNMPHYGNISILNEKYKKNEELRKSDLMGITDIIVKLKN